MNPVKAEASPKPAAGPRPSLSNGYSPIENAQLHEGEIPLEAAKLGRLLARRFSVYQADWRRSVFQLVTTALPFMAMLIAMGIMAFHHYWLALMLAIPAAGLLVRLFIFQHDCGHGSFFRSRAANNAVGLAISVLTLTPYDHWRRGHAIHHASSSNLDRRGRGDVETLTVDEYRNLSYLGRLGYRLYRSPYVQVLIGAPLNFIVLQRIPRGASFHDRSARRSILALDVALAVVFGLLIVMLGARTVLSIYLPVMILASWIGNWLFYVQHQFADAYWERDGEWNFYASALGGSSYFELPPILRWFSGNIGLHHIHHLCSRIPNYHLQDCFKDAPELNRVAKRITLGDSLGCWRVSLWDEERRMMVGFPAE